MGKLLSYSGTTTKIRAIKSRLLTRKDYETLAAMPTVTGALAYLKQKPSYEELFSGLDESTLHRSQVEQILTYSVYADFQKIYRFSTVQQRAFPSDAFRSPECFHGPDDLYRLFQPPFRFGSEQTFRQPDHR